MIDSDFVRPLCLPQANENIDNYHGKMCSIVGWGKLFEAGRIFRKFLIILNILFFLN
jgi:hypothetical protein